jgi:type VI secretion system Hcp family effector
MKTLLKFAASVAAAALIAVASLGAGTGSQDVPSASAASSDYFLKIEGIEGEIEVQSFSWGVSSPRDVATGQSSGKRQYQPLIIRKRIDKSTPLLFRMSGDSKQYIGTVTIVKRATEGTPEYKVTFQDVFISSFMHEGATGEPVSESVSFNYSKIEFK